MLRTHPPVHVDARGRPTRFAGEGPPDFLGAISQQWGDHASGTAIAIEAKTCRGPRWRFADLAEHQARDLAAVHRAGGIAAIALRLSDGSRWWVPWGRVGSWYLLWVAGEGAASIRVVDVGGPIPDDGWWGVR